jgi:hypothetical protein
VRQLAWGETTAHMKKRASPCVQSVPLGFRARATIGFGKGLGIAPCTQSMALGLGP